MRWVDDVVGEGPARRGVVLPGGCCTIPLYLSRLTAGWLYGFDRADPLRAQYGNAIAAWFAFATTHDIDPINPTSNDVDAWARHTHIEAPRESAGSAALASWRAWLNGPRPSWKLPSDDYPRMRVIDRASPPPQR